MGIRIRPAAAEEAAALSALALRSKAYWGYDEVFLAACRAELALAPGEIAERRTVVAEREGRLLGFATLEGQAPEGELGMLFVDPGTIGQGVGRALLDDVRARARRAGFRRLTLEADPHAEPFYRAMGAVRIGSSPSGSVPGRELPLMELRLEA